MKAGDRISIAETDIEIGVGTFADGERCVVIKGAEVTVRLCPDDARQLAMCLLNTTDEMRKAVS